MLYTHCAVNMKIFLCVQLTIMAFLWVGDIAVATQGDGSNELLIKNITQILDLLLKDYDNSQHPNYQEGRPTTIRTNILIKSMGPISELDMDYSMDCYFRQSWRDPRLSFRGPVDKLSLNIKMLEKLWRPDTMIINGKNSYVHTITVPNKLLRISQEGDILYSMRLTIKAKCPMCLRNFPMDTQSCPLLIGSFAYTSQHIIYHWDESGVAFVSGMTLSQFDLTSSPYQNVTLTRKEGLYSVLQVNFNLERHAGYFLIQVYVPCVLIVVLSWVSFWINREATSDRVGLGITAVLTLSTISLDSRTDLPKVHYATALDWFLLACFGYCMATLLEFSGVHYFTKIGSGETLGLDDEEEEEEWELQDDNVGWTVSQKVPEVNCSVVYNVQESVDGHFGWRGDHADRYETTPSKSIESKGTQTERKMSCFRQFLRCVVADLEFRRERMRSSIAESSTNSVSKIDRISRVLFPVSFTMLNITYWVMYYHISDECPRNRMSVNNRL